MNLERSCKITSDSWQANWIGHLSIICSKYIHFFEKYEICTLIQEQFQPVRLFFLKSLSSCAVIEDCMVIREIRVVHLQRNRQKNSNTLLKSEVSPYCKYLDDSVISSMEIFGLICICLVHLSPLFYAWHVFGQADRLLWGHLGPPTV